MSEALVRARSLTKLYGIVIGVNDVHLDLEPGVWGVLGPNGSGKSTLFGLITGRLRPTEGSLEVLGERPWNRPALFRRVGVCPQEDAFYSFYSALEFVSALARLSGFSAKSARIRATEALERVGAGGFLHRPIATYSKGMRQRTKLAQALVHDPELLVLDEPLTGMDPVARKETVDLVRSLGRQGRSLLVSSHVLHEVEAMTDAFLLMHGGRVLATGTVDEIRSSLAETPHRLQVAVAPADARRLAARLFAELPVEGVELDEAAGEASIVTRDPEAVHEGLARIAVEEELAIRSIAARDDDLTAVFNYLVHRIRS
jgi:ABC-2 type transport system ATP-binding protein